MNPCLVAFQFLEQCGEVTGRHKNFLNAIGKMPLIGTLPLLEPWSYVTDSYVGSFKVVMVPTIPSYWQYTSFL